MGKVKKITIVGTIHSEQGQCNEKELFEILKAINPDVIFEEIRSIDHGRLYRDDTYQTVEMKAISSYLKFRSVRQVPVDDFTIPGDFKDRIEELFSYVESASEDYHKAKLDIDRMAFTHGYRFLSSLTHIELNNKADELFEDAIAQSSSETLRGLLAWWYTHLRKRESFMLENIYNYCHKESFESGVFLVGAGHMSYLAKCIEDRLEAEKNIIDWRVWKG